MTLYRTSLREELPARVAKLEHDDVECVQTLLDALARHSGCALHISECAAPVEQYIRDVLRIYRDFPVHGRVGEFLLQSLRMRPPSAS